MPSTQIPLIEVRGTHRQVGRQIGESQKPALQRMMARLYEDLPAGVDRDAMLEQGRAYLAHSRAAYPQYVQELEGIAERSVGVTAGWMRNVRCDVLDSPGSCVHPERPRRPKT